MDQTRYLCIHHVKWGSAELEVFEYQDPDRPGFTAYAVTERHQLLKGPTAPRLIDAGALQTRAEAMAVAGRWIQQRQQQPQQ